MIIVRVNCLALIQQLKEENKNTQIVFFDA